jgi:hypothetical protein
VTILNSLGIKSDLPATSMGPANTKILVDQKEYGFYAPIWADFRELSSGDFEQAVAKDVAQIKESRDGVVISLADVTLDEEARLIRALKAIAAPIRRTLRVIRPHMDSRGRAISVIDVSKARERLDATRSMAGNLVSL